VFPDGFAFVDDFEKGIRDVPSSGLPAQLDETGLAAAVPDLDTEEIAVETVRGESDFD
jgi:hypothetical protein